MKTTSDQAPGFKANPPAIASGSGCGHRMFDFLSNQLRSINEISGISFAHDAHKADHYQ